MEEKEVYQETAKQTLKKLVDEKLEAVNKQKELEKALSNIEDEYASLKELHDKDVAQNRELAVQVRFVVLSPQANNDPDCNNNCVPRCRG